MKAGNCQHFSHNHVLIPLKLEPGEKIHCKACELLIIEPFHGCLVCNYYLHDHCLNAPRSLQHPSHPDHPLTLLSIPTYQTCAYSCDACGLHGIGFSYSCAHCEFDLHMNCAFLPATSKILNKHPHELQLSFDFPNILTCNDCGSPIEKNFWRYFCSVCVYGIHLGCAIQNQRQQLGSNRLSSEAAVSRHNAQLVSPQPPNDAVDRLREVVNEMAENQLALLKLQNQMHYSQAIANRGRWDSPRH